MSVDVVDLAVGALESLEMRSLTWGFVDQSLGEAEAQDAIAATLAAHELTTPPDEVLEQLCELSLVRMLPSPGERRYRTRFAELVRLLAHLRQWFKGRPWQTAPTLVADFRVDIRSRHYPNRHITPEEGWARLARESTLSELQSKLWQALTTRGSPLTFAEFQIDATGRLLPARRGTATIVTAGTGSGKTLAFYLPALLAISPVVRPNQWWTKALCLYPRNELLKDQFTQAYKLTLQTAPLLQQAGRRPIVFGSLFGPTPNDMSERSLKYLNWQKRGDDLVCPFLLCPKCESPSEMLWRRASIDARREMLHCASSTCDAQADGTTLRLTRQSMIAHPPDLLFTTTEMMNQRLSDLEYQALFGIRENDAERPLFALLDEAHTYAGVTGAQAALLLRRWMALVRTRVCWAGLSATLPNAERFFADLTGTRPDHVACIAPAPSEMISEGAEYNIILRSDASSRVATLSTSIQTLMLLGRMLDPRAAKISEGRFGSRVFAFTDDLDATNRLFDNLLDAEAYTRWRTEDNSRLPLAALRGSAQPDAQAREREGQSWQMAEDIRDNLGTRLRVSRTSSRDPGVEANADVIVATSSLEVGFNDSDVGAVFQHKAPHSAASFLQRRGRAGRNRRMRPITAVVLSDYGRDRVAFQSYETLFDPTVEIAPLPIRNLYVLRMQAVYATLDWIATQAPRGMKGWSWRAFAGPETGTREKSFREHARRTLQKIVRMDADTIAALSAHLKMALTIDDKTLESVLWQPPRAVLLEALPTLARRLFRGWRLASGDGLDFHVAAPPHPLPDFVPRTLFADLQLPEVQLHVPTGDGNTRPETMPILPALQQFAPGRARRRFADRQGRLAHWMPLDLAQLSQNLEVTRYAAHHEYLGEKDGVSIFRPWELRLETLPQSVYETSNAAWKWQSAFELLGEGKQIALPRLSGTDLLANHLEFRLHRFGDAVSIWRFAHDGVAALKVNGQDRRIDFRLVDDQKNPAAVGFSFEADALLVPFGLPSPAELARLSPPGSEAAWWKYLAIAHHVDRDPLLSRDLNSFIREWLYQVVLVTALVSAEREGLTLAEALDQLRAENPTRFKRAIDALVDAAHTPWPDDDDDPGALPTAESSQLSSTLEAALGEPGVTAALVDLIRRWVEPSEAAWGGWLRHLARATLSEAVCQACLIAAPQNAATEGLTVDVEEIAGHDRVLVAETTVGGGGTIESLAEAFAAEPRAFMRALESACTATDQEMAADALRRIVAQLAEDPGLAGALAALRAATDTEARDKARHEFFRLLAVRGLPTSRTLSILVATRLVRPGASPTTDRVMLQLLRAWQQLETKHGLALPVRVAAAAVVMSTPLLELRTLARPGEEISMAGMLLWPAAGELRQRALQSYNPYRAAPLVDAALVRLLLFERRLLIVKRESPDWEARIVKALAEDGVVRLVTTQNDPNWRAALARLLGEPIVSGFLHFYPMIEATRILDDGSFAIDLALRDRV